MIPTIKSGAASPPSARIAEAVAAAGRLPIVDLFELHGPGPTGDSASGATVRALGAMLRVRDGAPVPSGPVVLRTYDSTHLIVPYPFWRASYPSLVPTMIAPRQECRILFHLGDFRAKKFSTKLSVGAEFAPVDRHRYHQPTIGREFSGADQAALCR